MIENNIILDVKNVSKIYRLGEYNSSSFKQDIKRLKNLIFNNVDIYKENAQSNDRNMSSDSEFVWSLRDINFSLNKGDALGIIGRNGAGKSTLLKILSRVTSPSEGQIKIKGKISSLLEVGTGFHPELSGRDNIFLNGAILGMNKNEISNNFDEIVSFAGVERYIDTPVKRYSSGMYVRLAFAVAAFLKAEILVVDEVLAVGDVEFQEKCLSKMNDVTGSGRTILFVSHNMGAIRNLCSKVLILEQGISTFLGDTDDGINKYMQGPESVINTAGIWKPKHYSGNKYCSINMVRLLDHQSNIKDKFDISNGLTIEIDYSVLIDGYKNLFSLTLFDQKGQCVFSSINNKEKKYFGKKMPVGDYKSKCIIPGDILNDGIYSISIVGMSGERSDPYSLEYILKFEAIDDGILSKGFDGGYGGFIRPNLKWDTSKIN